MLQVTNYKLLITEKFMNQDLFYIKIIIVYI